MKNNFLIYVLSCLWLGFSLDSIGQNRYHEDSTRMTEDSSWCEPHYREDGRVDNLIMVSFSYPLLLIRNNEPVTGIVYSLWPNGNVSTENIIKTDCQFAMKKDGGRMVNLGTSLNITQNKKSGIERQRKRKNGLKMVVSNPKRRIIIGERMAIFY
tara:strand:+ start:561 stop:1025 length:465 start_codon:yes stop_codon:yes gene_type:complete